jgi:glycosyltransferase involved in cell wall biosynthesis
MRAEIARWFPLLDTVVSLTDADCRALGEHLRHATRVEQIPNCLPAVERRRSPQTRPIVIAAGRLTPVKQFDKLVHAWSEVAAAAPDWELRIFGAGGAEPRLRKLVSRLHLYNSVKLMGTSNRLQDELAKASLVALSSRAEGYPTIIMEAMSHGVPVVSFDCPNGPAEMITDGVDGVLVPLNDVAALSRALIDLMGDSAKRRRYAEAALAASHRFTAEAVTDRWESLLSDLIEARRHGR